MLGLLSARKYACVFSLSSAQGMTFFVQSVSLGQEVAYRLYAVLTGTEIMLGLFEASVVS